MTAAFDALPDDWVQQNVTAQQQEVVTQARFYSRHPEQPRADFQPYDTGSRPGGRGDGHAGAREAHDQLGYSSCGELANTSSSSPINSKYSGLS